MRKTMDSLRKVSLLAAAFLLAAFLLVFSRSLDYVEQLNRKQSNEGMAIASAESCTRLLKGQKADVVPKPRWKLTILLHSSEATWQGRAQTVKDTWLSEPLASGIRLFWVLDKNMTSEPSIFISHSTRPGLKPFREERGAMAERVLQAFIEVERKDPSDWYLKIDDDTFVNLENVMAMLSDPELQDPATKRYYLGLCQCPWWVGIRACNELLNIGSNHYDCEAFKWEQDDPEMVADQGTYACGGPGYLLSEGSLRGLVAYEKEKGCLRAYEDMMVGWTLMRALNTTCTRVPKAYDFYNELNSSYIPVGPHQLATAHKIQPEEMHLLWQQLQATRQGNVTKNVRS